MRNLEIGDSVYIPHIGWGELTGIRYSLKNIPIYAEIYLDRDPSSQYNLGRNDVLEPIRSITKINDMARPKTAEDLKIMSINVSRDTETLVDNLAREAGISRAELARRMFHVGVQLATDAKSHIILEEERNGEWIAFDPYLGKYSCYGKGEGPESALDSYLDEEETFLENLNDEGLNKT